MSGSEFDPSENPAKRIRLSERNARYLEEAVRKGVIEDLDQYVNGILESVFQSPRVNREALQGLIRLGIEQADAGQTRPWDFEKAKERLRRKLDAIHENAGSDDE